MDDSDTLEIADIYGDFSSLVATPTSVVTVTDDGSSTRNPSLCYNTYICSITRSFIIGRQKRTIQF